MGTEKYSAIYTGAGLNSFANNVIQMPTLDGTITGVYLDFPAATDGDALFNLTVDGTEQVSSSSLTIADTDTSVDVTGLSIVTTKGSVIALNLEAPLPTTLPDPPYNLIITYDLGTTSDAADIAAAIHAATGKTTPVDADELALIDSAASNVLKKLTWANLKATLKTYFDTLYPAETASTLGATINGSSAATPNNTDLVATVDTSVVKKITWTNVKAFLKTYFDTLYLAAGSIDDTAYDATTWNGDTTHAPSKNAISDKIESLGTLSDGDKGDITVSGTGATWTIDNDVVTYAKMQNVSATSRILGRKTASAGDTEECTLSEILDFIGSAAQGDILYRGASGWARLGAGTSGNFLKTQGAAANPVWAAVPGGGDLLSTNNLSDVANAGTARTNLGLAIGTNVQAWDADLDALAALSGTNTIYYRSAANTWTAVTIGTNLTFSAGTLSASGGGGGMTWTEVTGTSQSAAVNHGYVANNASLVTVTLPSTAAVGDIVAVTGIGAGGWKIAQNASQEVKWTAGGVDASNETTAGTGGYLASTDQYDGIELICLATNNVWGVRSAKGVISLV